MATSKQAKKLIEVFEDVGTDLMQEILGDGLLAIVRDRRDLAQQFISVARGFAEIWPIEHTIDFSVPCRLPFDGAECVSPAKSGVDKLELRDDNLYLNGKKIELVLSNKQKGSGVIVGHKLSIEREKLGGNLSAKILDYLEEHPELWPESWKKDVDDNIIYIYFWYDIFRDPVDDALCVRYGYWDGGKVVSSYSWLDDDWDRRFLAASTVS